MCLQEEAPQFSNHFSQRQQVAHHLPFLEVPLVLVVHMEPSHHHQARTSPLCSNLHSRIKQCYLVRILLLQVQLAVSLFLNLIQRPLLLGCLPILDVPLVVSINKEANMEPHHHLSRVLLPPAVLMLVTLYLGRALPSQSEGNVSLTQRSGSEWKSVTMLS